MLYVLYFSFFFFHPTHVVWFAVVFAMFLAGKRGESREAGNEERSVMIPPLSLSQQKHLEKVEMQHYANRFLGSIFHYGVLVRCCLIDYGRKPSSGQSKKVQM